MEPQQTKTTSTDDRTTKKQRTLGWFNHKKYVEGRKTSPQGGGSINSCYVTDDVKHTIQLVSHENTSHAVISFIIGIHVYAIHIHDEGIYEIYIFRDILDTHQLRKKTN